MTPEEILRLPSIPPASPSYPHGPFRFKDREYFIVVYDSDPDAIREALPEPLEPIEEPRVFYEWIRMPDSSGFGDYTESGVVIPAYLDGKRVSFTAQMYLDDHPPIAGGREIWGFPKKWAQPELSVHKDTLTGTLYYSGERVAVGTMTYKHEPLARDPAKARAALETPVVLLKLVPHVDGKPAIAQLVSVTLTDITIKGAWSGKGRLHLIPHVNAPVADLPVRKVIAARHIIADLTLPYGEVVHDYLR